MDDSLMTIHEFQQVIDEKNYAVKDEKTCSMNSEKIAFHSKINSAVNILYVAHRLNPAWWKKLLTTIMRIAHIKCMKPFNYWLASNR